MQNGKQNLKAMHYFGIIFAVACVIAALSFVSMSVSKNFFYNKMEVESQRIARSYAQHIGTANEASTIINSVLEDKLLAVCNMLVLVDDEITNELLGELADSVGVDDIYLYDGLATIVYSARQTHIGWTAPIDHPVHNFMISGNTSWIDEIRPDTETGVYYKFGYYRLDSEHFFQVGILAEQINQFLANFQTQQFLNEIQNEATIKGAYYISNAFNIDAFWGIGGVEDVLVSEHAIAAMQANTEYNFSFAHNELELFLVSLPIYVNQTKIGTLAVLHDTAETNTLVQYFNIIWTVGFSLIFGLVVSIALANYYNNKKLYHYAYHDIATDLPNKRLFDQEVKRLSANTNPKALVMLSCKNFHFLHLHFGYDYYEKVKTSLAHKLKLFATEDKLLFQISDEKCAFFVQNYDSEAELVSFAKGLLKFMRSFLVHKATGALVGIAAWEDGVDDVNTILKKATIATQYIPEEELFQHATFTTSMHERVLREEKIETELLHAITGKTLSGLYIDYQPIINMKTNQVAGFEALTRLKTLEYGMISPNEFIPIAERTQLIVPLFNQIMQKICAFIKTVENSNISDFKISVNISAIQVLRDDFVSRTLNMIAQNQIKTTNLEIEISESVFSEHHDFINSKLAILQQKGVHIAIDNYGTGFSPLYQEDKLNINTLKLDRGFVSRINSKSLKHLVLSDVISMAHRMGNVVVAQGVETEVQRDYLSKNHCDYYQGFLHSKPLSPKDALELIKQKNNAAN